jgi:phosphoglycolate phosphatase
MLCKQSLDISTLKAVVFDWDNTLAESRSSLVLAVNQVLSSYGLPDWEISSKKRNSDLSFRDNFKNIFGAKADEAYKKYTAVYLQNVASHITAFPRTLETIRFFRQHHIAVMIMTNKDRRLLEYELPLLFDPKLFDNIVCGHEAKQDKPYREHLFKTLYSVLSPEEITPETVWVIGDSPQDSRCAQSAGARAIRIGDSIWKEEENTLSKDILFFDSFCSFYDALRHANL